MQRIILCTLLAALCISALAEVTLVKDGQPMAEIVTGENPTRCVQLAALELNHHVRLVTGTELPVRVTPQGNMSSRIFIGECTGIPCPVRQGERMIRRFRGQDILLTGTDTSSRGKVNYQDHRTFPMTTYQWDYVYTGPLFAVYDFLEDLCGVRFFWFNDSGTRYQPRTTLMVKENDREHSPPMDAFRAVYVSRKNLQDSGVSPRERMLWGLRWRHCLHFGLTNHNGYSIYFAHYAPAKTPGLRQAFRGARPEFFAQGYQGAGAGAGNLLRANYPNDQSLPPQLCFTNPGVVEYYASEVLAYARGGNVIGGWKNRSGAIPVDQTLIPRFDGQPFFYPIEGADNQSFCQCQACQRLNAKTGSVSNSKFHFMGEIAKAVAKVDSGAGVSSLAYINSLPYPKMVNLPPNLSIQICLPFYTWWHPTAAACQRREYKLWVEHEAKRRVLSLWTYLFNPAWDSSHHFGGYKCFPGLYPEKTAEFFREFVQDGLRGWFSEITDPVNAHLEMYLASRICYDRNADASALLDDYFTGYYGAAGPQMRELYRQIEKLYWNPANCPAQWLKDPNVVIGPRGPKNPYWTVGLHSPELNWSIGTPERLAELDKFIQTASAQKLTDGEKAALDRFVATIWKPALEGRRDYETMCERMRHVPEIKLVKVPEAGGDADRIDWKTVPQSHRFTDFHGRDIGNTSRIQVATDGTFLFLRFHEDKAPDVTRPHGVENIEIFFAGNREYPVYQLVIGANGIVHSYVREYATEQKDFGARVVSRPAQDSWEVLVSVPMANLPFRDGALSANVYRAWDWRNGGAAVWSPVYYSRVFISGLPYFGSLLLPD